MLAEHQIEDENVHMIKSKPALKYEPPSNRSYTKCLKILAAASDQENRVLRIQIQECST